MFTDVFQLFTSCGEEVQRLIYIRSSEHCQSLYYKCCFTPVEFFTLMYCCFPIFPALTGWLAGLTALLCFSESCFVFPCHVYLHWQEIITHLEYFVIMFVHVFCISCLFSTNQTRLFFSWFYLFYQSKTFIFQLILFVFSWYFLCLAALWPTFLFCIFLFMFCVSQWCFFKTILTIYLVTFIFKIMNEFF